MLSVGASFPSFELSAVVNSEMKFPPSPIRLCGQVEGLLLLAQGLHLCLSHRDCRLWPTEPGVRRPQRAGAGWQHRLGVCSLGVAHERPPCRTCLPHAQRHQARTLDGAGILDPKAGVAQRATFIVDPENVIRFVYVTDLSVGRDPQEVLRVLDGLQNGGLIPAAGTRARRPSRSKAIDKQESGCPTFAAFCFCGFGSPTTGLRRWGELGWESTTPRSYLTSSPKTDATIPTTENPARGTSRRACASAGDGSNHQADLQQHLAQVEALGACLGFFHFLLEFTYLIFLFAGLSSSSFSSAVHSPDDPRNFLDLLRLVLVRMASTLIRSAVSAVSLERIFLAW